MDKIKRDRIKVSNVSKKYKQSDGESFTAVSGINMEIEQGEFVSVLGESGSGKSTLARMILGLESPDEGCILLDGKDTKTWGYDDWRLNRSKIQGVFQDAFGTLNPKLSVLRNMEIGLKCLTDLNKKQRRERLYELMDKTNISKELLNTPVKLLSGGEKRRISLLRALSVNPKYLVLDEITGGIDLISQNAVMELLESIKAHRLCGCLLITHDQKNAYRLSDKIVVMARGEIIKKGIKREDKI